MEENKKKRPAKKPENPVREWISDNLRYMMLFGGIALAVILVVVIVNLANGVSSNADAVQQNSTSVQSQTEEQSEQEDSSGSSADSASDTDEEIQSTVSPTAEATPEATPEPAEEAEQPDGSQQSGLEQAQQQDATQSSGQQSEAAGSTDEGLTAADSSVISVVTTYFDSLARADADAAASVVESISDEDRSAITQGLFANSYRNYEIYTYPGEEDGSYVIFAKYEYTYPGYSTAVPALTQLYVFTRDDGSLCIASDERQQTKADYMSSLLNREDVSELVVQVQSEYDAALASDSALAKYIRSISG